MGEQDSQVAAELGQLGQMIFGMMASQAIYTAAKLEIADLIGTGSKAINELTQATKTHADSLLRLLRMLTSVGIFAEDADGRFKQTRLSELLRSDHPRSARGLAILTGSPFFWQSWGELHAAVIDGQSGFKHIFGVTFFDYFAEHPEGARIVNEGMTSASAMDATAVVAAYDFSKFEQIVDIGGGHGGLLHAILSANPKLHGVLADQASVVASASTLRTGAIANRCTIEGVDFFASVPEGGDAYIMKWVLHDWERRGLSPNPAMLQASDSTRRQASGC
jgi:hypothetical protein